MAIKYRRARQPFTHQLILISGLAGLAPFGVLACSPTVGTTSNPSGTADISWAGAVVGTGAAGSQIGGGNAGSATGGSPGNAPGGTHAGSGGRVSAESAGAAGAANGIAGGGGGSATGGSLGNATGGSLRNATGGSPGNATGGTHAGSGGRASAGSAGTGTSTSGSPGNAVRQHLLDYLWGISGKKTIAGQHNKVNATPSDATDWVKGNTGKQPGLWSGDFLFGQDALDNRGKMIAEAIRQWNAGAVVQLMYHNCVPTRDERCGWDDIGGANPQHLTNDQWAQLVTTGTDLHKAWLSRLDGLSVYFKTLKDAGVAPLFRPLHEMNQDAFWWGGHKGSQGTLKLFQITYDYLVKTKGFDNIIWVWDVQDFSSLSSDVQDYNPGPTYYDIAALDVYDGSYTDSKYSTMLAAAPNKLIAIGECEHLPTAAELVKQPRWLFFMLWPDFTEENAGVLPPLYAASNVLTEDEMPGWK